MRTTSLVTAVLCFVVACTGVATAQTAMTPRACTQRDSALLHLAQKYSETPTAIGLTSNGGVIEVLTAPTGETWTIVLTMPSGITCMIASGEGWETIDQVVAGPRT